MEENKRTKRKKKKYPMETEGFGWRVSVSIVSFVLLIAFIILWLFFYADSYSVYQNIAVIVAAVLLFCGAMGGAWAAWGMKHADECNEC